MRETAGIGAASAVADVGLEVDLAAVGRGAVAVLPTRGALETTSAVGAGSGCMGPRGTTISTCPAVAHGCVRVGLTAVALVSVAVSPAAVARVDVARAAYTLALTVGEQAGVVTVSTVLSARRYIGFTPRDGCVAITEARTALGNVAGAVDAYGGAGACWTRVAARVAIGGIRVEIHLATVADVVIAVSIAVVAVSELAGSAAAGCRCVGEGATDAALSAVGKVDGDVELTTVGGGVVAIAPTDVARLDGAGARKAGRGCVGQGAGATALVVYVAAAASVRCGTAAAVYFAAARVDRAARCAKFQTRQWGATALIGHAGTAARARSIAFAAVQSLTATVRKPSTNGGEVNAIVRNACRRAAAIGPSAPARQSARTLSAINHSQAAIRQRAAFRS